MPLGHRTVVPARRCARRSRGACQKTLYRLDQVGYEVVVALELDVYLRPSLLGPVTPPDQAVVGEDSAAHQHDNHNQNDDYQEHCIDTTLVGTFGPHARPGSGATP